MSIEEWHADIIVTKELVTHCLQEQFGSIIPIQEVKYIDEGWDNKIFLVNKTIIFRFPRRKAAIDLMKRENILLNNLPYFTDVDIPKLKYIGNPTPSYPCPFHGYEMIKGVPGYHAKLSLAARANSIATMALFLKQLHHIDESQAKSMGVIRRICDDESNLAHIIDTLKERTNKINVRSDYRINMKILADEITHAKKLTLTNEHCLVHNDLDCRHLIFNNSQLVGIIDWGDADIANKAIDLSIIWSFYPEDCHSQFFDNYGMVDDDTWRYARFLGIYGAISQLVYGIDLNDADLVTEAICSIKRINNHLLKE